MCILRSPLHNYFLKLNNSGVSQAEIFRRLIIPRATITDILKRFRNRGNVENTHRSGAPSKLSRRDTRCLLRVVRKNPGEEFGGHYTPF